jgi:hypothetical protein
VYSAPTLCLKHISQKSENEQLHMDFWSAVQVQLAEKYCLLDAEKAEQSSLFSVCCRPRNGFLVLRSPLSYYNLNKRLFLIALVRSNTVKIQEKWPLQ